MDVQADLSLHRAQMSEGIFSHFVTCMSYGNDVSVLCNQDLCNPFVCSTLFGGSILTLKALVTTAADGNFDYFNTPPLSRWSSVCLSVHLLSISLSIFSFKDDNFSK